MIVLVSKEIDLVHGNMLKKIILFALLFVSVFCFVATLSNMYVNKNVNAQSITCDISSINDNYALNDSVVFPDNVDVEFNGKTYTANYGMVQFPNGDLVSISN